MVATADDVLQVGVSRMLLERRVVHQESSLSSRPVLQVWHTLSSR